MFRIANRKSYKFYLLSVPICLKCESLSQCMTKHTKGLVRPAKTDQPAHLRSLIRAFADRMCLLQPPGCVWGWGGDRVWRRCILRHRGVHLILAYSWARPAILEAGKGREGMIYFFCFFAFIPVPLSSLSLSFIYSSISPVSFLPFSGRQHKMTNKG